MDSDDEGTGLREDILEKCCLANKVVEIPQSFCSDEDIFKEVLNIETWENELNQKQKDRLKMLLPTFPTSDNEEKDETLRKLFAGENFKFGNPLDHFFERLKDGFMAPEVAEADRALKMATHREYKNQQKQYHYCLLQQILISRKKLLDSAYMLPPDQPVKMQQFTAKPKDATLCERTRLRYFSILQDVREECCEPNTSSEDENYPESSPPKVTRKHKKQLQILEASLSPEITRVMSTTAFPPGYPGSSHFLNRCLDMIEVSEERYREMLLAYKQKKISDPTHPELDVSNVDLNDMVTRANLSKRPLLKLESHSKKKPKVQENADKTHKAMPAENEKHAFDMKPHISTLTRSTQQDNVTFVNTSEKCMEANISLIIENQLKADSKVLKLEVDHDRVCENTIPSATQEYYQYPTCFFSLLRDFFWDSAELKISASKLEEKVRVWQEGPTAAYHDWLHLHETWSDLISSALRFLAGDLLSILPENFVPFLDYKEKQQQWQWIGSGRDSEEQLSALCQHWLENKDDVSLDVLETSQGSPPPPRVLTGWTVRATTDEEKLLYREQECIRYQNPHKAFTFRVHGYESVVGPVKGVYGKESGVNKAREHSLLISDRPPFVTILSLVRDAAARLPNGEGTRADICELLKDSQYLSLASDQQVSYIHTVVSGALDRLHYEKDPCVKYDVNRKLWIYLHRNRTEEEFERIHQAQAAAAKARKAVQKNKSPKPKNREAQRTPASAAASSASESSAAFLNVDVTTVSPATSHSPRGSGSPRTQGSPKHSHPAVNRHLIRNLPLSIQANTKLSVPVIPDHVNTPRKSELIQTNLASSSSSPCSSASLRYSVAATNTAICSPQHSLASSVFPSFPSDGNNSRPPSQGSVQSLPSPKTVIANVNAAQFVSVGSFQVGPTTVEQPVSSSSVAPCIGVLSVDMKSSSPSFVGQPPVLQPVLSHQTMATSSPLTVVPTASSLVSSSGAIPKSKLLSTQHTASNSKAIPGFQTIVIKSDAALRAGGNLSSLPLLSAEELSAADSAVLNNNPVVARFLHGSQLLSLGNLVTGATSANLLKQGANTVQNIKIQGTNFAQQSIPMSNVNLFQSRHASASVASDMKLPRLSVVSQENSGPDSLISSASLMGPSALLSFNQGTGMSSLETKVSSASHREMSEVKRIAIPSHSLAEIKPTVTDLGRILDSAGAPNHVISSSTAITPNITNYSIGKSASSSLVIGTQEALKPMTSTYVMTSPITNASMLSSPHGLRAATSLNMRALHSIKVIPVPQSLGSGKNIRHAPLLARIISPSTGMTLRTVPSELMQSAHQLKGATAMNIVHGLQSVATQPHMLKAAASHTCTNSEIPNQPFIIQVQAPKTANEELNL